MGEQQAEGKSGQSWAEREFASLDCKDERRKRRFVRVAGNFADQPGASIPKACGDWSGTKACYRLFEHEVIEPGAILESHRVAMLNRLKESTSGTPLLVVQDTTSLNYATHDATEGLGPTCQHGKKGTPGLFIHGQLVVGVDGAIHGLAGASIYARKPRAREEAPSKRNREAVSEKESQRWVEGWKQAQRLWEDLGGQRTVLSVADREGDIYELFALCLQTRTEHGGGAGVLIRSRHDRLLEESGGRLWQEADALPFTAEWEVELPRGKQGLAMRTARLAVRAGLVRLTVPCHKRRYLGLKESLELWALEINEINAPAGCPPVQWRLLTTEPVKEAADAQRLTAWYALRWRIELLHRVLKTGCRVERRQVRCAEKLKAFLALDLVVATYLLGLTWQARVAADASVEGWLEREEWEALMVHAAGGGEPPETPPALGEAVRLIAKLGGFLARKGDGNPGPEVLWRGLSTLRVLTEAWRMLRPKRCG